MGDLVYYSRMNSVMSTEQEALDLVNASERNENVEFTDQQVRDMLFWKRYAAPHLGGDE